MMKKITIKVFLFLAIFLVIFILYKKLLSPNEKFLSVNVVPDNAFMIIESDNPYKAWGDIDNSSLWKHIQKNPFFNEINNQIISIDSLINENKILFRLFGSRNVLISIHQSERNNIASLIVADMKKLSQMKVLKNYLGNLNNNDYSISKRIFAGFEIYEIYDRENKEMLYISFVRNLILFSFSHLLLESSLQQTELPILARNPDFIEISNQVKGNGQLRIYLNFKEIYKLIKWSDRNNSFSSFIRLLYFAGFELTIEDKLLNLEGYLNGTDTVPTFINALTLTKEGGNDMAKYIPNRSFIYMHLSYGSFTSLLSNLEENLKQENMYDDYIKNRRKIEKLLEININQHVISWIGDEIGILNVRSKYKNTTEEYVLVVKATEGEEAIKNLNYISTQVKKNIPVKFKTISYKGIDINYLSATGLFKLFFGKYFSKLEKPYYMVKNQYVYFSNHPQTLKDIIDDLAEKKEMAEWNEYQNFNKLFSSHPKIFVFVNTPVFFEEKKNNQLSAYQKEIEKNQIFIDQLPFLGIEINGKKNLFYTHLVWQYRDIMVNNFLDKPIWMQPDPMQVNAEPVIISETTNIQETDTFNMFEVPDFAVLNLTTKKHIEYYEDNALKIEVETNGGIKNGDFIWYYPNGKVKLKGKYKNDQQTGIWKYYDENGTIKGKKRFN